jgi:cellulose biosynthesis protein BcsQ
VVLVPVTNAPESMDGAAEAMAAVEVSRKKLGGRARVLGFLKTLMDEREGVTGEAREVLRQQYGPQLFKAEVRISTRAKVLPKHRLTSWDPGADPRGAEDHQAVVAEALRRLKHGGK